MAACTTSAMAPHGHSRHAPPNTGFFCSILCDGWTMFGPTAVVCPLADSAAPSRVAIKYGDEIPGFDTVSPRRLLIVYLHARSKEGQCSVLNACCTGVAGSLK